MRKKIVSLFYQKVASLKTTTDKGGILEKNLVFNFIRLLRLQVFSVGRQVDRPHSWECVTFSFAQCAGMGV